MNLYWSIEMDCIELGFCGPPYHTDESTSIMHRFAKAFGIAYGIAHNYWRLGGS